MCLASNNSTYLKSDFENLTVLVHYLAPLHIGIFLIDISRQTKVRYLHLPALCYEYIPCRKISMNKLDK